MVTAHEFKDIEIGDILTLFFDEYQLTGTYKGIEGNQILLEVHGKGGQGSANLQKCDMAAVKGWARTEALVDQMINANFSVAFDE